MESVTTYWFHANCMSVLCSLITFRENICTRKQIRRMVDTEGGEKNTLLTSLSHKDATYLMK